jgi:chitinase
MGGIEMNQPINDGGPAFPHTTQWDGITPAINHHGISMRDYFAAAALQGLIANGGCPTWDDDAKAAYAAADAMLKAMETK